MTICCLWARVGREYSNKVKHFNCYILENREGHGIVKDCKLSPITPFLHPAWIPTTLSPQAWGQPVKPPLRTTAAVNACLGMLSCISALPNSPLIYGGLHIYRFIFCKMSIVRSHLCRVQEVNLPCIMLPEQTKDTDISVGFIKLWWQWIQGSSCACKWTPCLQEVGQSPKRVQATILPAYRQLYAKRCSGFYHVFPFLFSLLTLLMLNSE